MKRFVGIYSLLMLLVLLFATTGCLPTTQEETRVFPEGSASCNATAHKTRYLVKKKNGKVVKVYANSREEMLEKYVRPKLDELVHVEADQRIYAYESSGDGQQFTSAVETWGVERIQAATAWNQNFKGQNVIVAVIDSGVDISHSNLSSQIYTNTIEANGSAGVDDDHNGFIDDVHGWDFALESPINHDTSGHGTHVAGIIAGAHANGLKGVAPSAKILPLDFMNGPEGYTSDAIEAIEYSKLMKAKVINASWGSDACSSILNDSIDSLAAKNILFVTAAGNSGNDITIYPEYPAAFISSPQITVGSITQRGFMSSFSNYGMLVDVMAPGDQILSTVPGNDYMYMSGTSMAAPYVAGMAAILLSKKPNLTVAQLKNTILNSVTKRSYSVKTEGEINVPQALVNLDSL